ncbi:MAG: HD domain-containing protein [Lachnospiraceae bacterium]|nr:HD domain-containing protein [Lachnospiraceae bacterium]
MNMQINRINRALLIGWSVFVFILCTMYGMEALRGVRSAGYVLVFCLITIIPQIINVFIFFRDPESTRLQYHIIAGFSIMYAFVLFTGLTPMVWTYILPMLSLLVLYHNPRLIAICGGVTVLLNLTAILVHYHSGVITDLFDRDVRIQVFVIVLCFTALFFAAVIYDSIYRNNLEYVNELSEQKEELHSQAEELEALNGELSLQAEKLRDNNEQMRKMTMQTIMTIANTIDAKDEYTRGHSRRVSEYAAAIAEEMGYEGDDLRDIRFTGLLHDIGKIGVPDSVLNKPGKLTKAEFQIMKDHTVTGGEILRDITIIKGLDVGARYHHERYDGKGYPEGLKGDEIPETARIIGVADAYDAMTSNRIYRRHLSRERVMEELRKGRGTQFDPAVCDVLIKLAGEDRLPVLNIDEDPIEIQQTTRILTRVIDKAEEVALEELHYDELTGTLTKDIGIRQVQREIQRNGRGTLAVFNLDHFRKVNEMEGFAVGDKYLQLLCEHIKALCDENFIIRYGPDEFVAYITDIDTEEDSEFIAEQFIGNIAEVTSIDPQYHMLSVSIGMTPVATEKDRFPVLYENACKALFVARQYGEGRYFYHRMELAEEDDVAIANSVDMENLMTVIAESESRECKGYKLVEDFDEFRKGVAYRLRESDETMYLILVTLRWTGEDTFESKNREEPMITLENAIRHSIRSSDMMSRYSNVQYAVLLSGLDEEVIRQIINRVMSEFYRVNSARGVEVHYDAADLSRPEFMERLK